jgi:hypothetical protein
MLGRWSTVHRIEAGRKTVPGSRLKQSGMFWTVRAANAIVALRCSHRNGRFEGYWEARVQPEFHFSVAHPTARWWLVGS